MCLVCLVCVCLWLVCVCAQCVCVRARVAHICIDNTNRPRQQRNVFRNWVKWTADVEGLVWACTTFANDVRLLFMLRKSRDESWKPFAWLDPSVFQPVASACLRLSDTWEWVLNSLKTCGGDQGRGYRRLQQRNLWLPKEQTSQALMDQMSASHFPRHLYPLQNSLKKWKMKSKNVFLLKQKNAMLGYKPYVSRSFENNLFWWDPGDTTNPPSSALMSPSGIQAVSTWFVPLPKYLRNVESAQVDLITGNSHTRDRSERPWTRLVGLPWAIYIEQ